MSSSPDTPPDLLRLARDAAGAEVAGAGARSTSTAMTPSGSPETPLPPLWLAQLHERRAAAAAAAALDASSAARTPFDTVKFIARASLGVGVLGAGAGVCLATFRGHDTSLYAVTMGANYTVSHT